MMGHCRPEIQRGDDGGCFASALGAVRQFGGVLEHPVYSHAWSVYDLPRPRPFGGWTANLTDPGFTAEVDQAWYGHRANKRTWLYAVGVELPELHWGSALPTGITVRNDGGGGRDQRSRTPNAFRDVLLDMARSAL